jgi:arylsulfatase A-like enzyme
MTTTRRAFLLRAGITAGAAALAGATGLYGRLASAQEDPRHVVLLSCDALRADRLGVYGYSRVIGAVSQSLTPHLDALAQRGAVFLNNYAQANWTETSMASMWRSAWPVNTAATHNFAYLGDRPSLLASNLTQTTINQRHYDKVQIQTNRLLLKDLYTEQFSDVLNETSVRDPDENAECTPSLIYPRAAVVAKRIRTLLRLRDRGKNLFLNAHFMDVHEPYTPISTFSQRLGASVFDPTAYGTCLAADIRTRDHGGEFTDRELEALQVVNDVYDASLMHLDEAIGEIAAALDDDGLSKNALVIIMGDHGQSLEERAVGHGTSLWNSEIRTPLIIYGAGVPGGLFVSANTRNVDIMPTVADFVGITNKRRMDGQSLVPLINDAAHGVVSESREAFTLSDCPKSMTTTELGRKGFALVDPDGWKYVTFSSYASGKTDEYLYDLRHDLLEEANLASSEPEKLQSFRDRLADLLSSRKLAPAKPAHTRLVTPEKAEQLRALGYIGR